MSKYVNGLLVRKTNNNLRGTYVYNYTNGPIKKTIISEGKETVYYTDGRIEENLNENLTTEYIKSLHGWDDKEVYYNCKYFNYETSNERKNRIVNKKQWDLEHMDDDGFVHGDNPYVKPKKIIRFDFNYDNEDDYQDSFSKSEYEAIKLLAEEKIVDSNKQKLRDYVSTLSPRLQSIYYYIFVLRYSQQEYCAEFGLTKSTVSEAVKKLNEKILNYFSK